MLYAVVVDWFGTDFTYADDDVLTIVSISGRCSTGVVDGCLRKTLAACPDKLASHVFLIVLELNVVPAGRRSVGAVPCRPQRCAIYP